jgi:uncharacterized MAPEG superfamily protein
MASFVFWGKVAKANPEPRNVVEKAYVMKKRSERAQCSSHEGTSGKADPPRSMQIRIRPVGN